MPTPSLTALCTKACIKNVASLTDVGDFEYWKIKPVLLRVASPEQLHEIEEASPQIRGEDAELWQAFIARDIPDWRRKNYVPKNPLKWYQVYKRYKKEQRKEIELDKAKLIEAMQGLKKEKEAHLTEKVKDTTRLPKLPKDSRMMANNGGVPIGGRRKGIAKSPSVLAFMAGSKTKITSPAALLTRARREAKEISCRNKLCQPTDQLRSKTRILQAPQGMVNEYRTASKPAIRIFTPRKKCGSGVVNDNRPGHALDEREQRLRALTMKHTSEVGSYILVGSDSDSNHSDTEEEDDLFNEPKTKPTPKKSIPNTKPLPSSSRPQAQSSKPISMSASKPAPASLRSNPKPSDVVSSLVSKFQPPQSQSRSQPQGQAVSSTQSKSSPSPNTTTVRSPSPVSNSSLRAPGRPLPKPSVIMKRKAEVDIFNRRTKK